MMKDTPPEVEERFRQMLMARTPGERLEMACDMFQMARELMRAQILAENPKATEKEVRREIFLRTYGQDFDAETLNKILRAFEEREGTRKRPG